jgi:hypothetical protein
MSDLTTLVVLAHLVSTAVMVGVIWTVQLVHYPLMALVGAERFPAYESAHAPRMAVVVMLPWTVEGATTLWLLMAPPPGVPPWLLGVGAAAAATTVAVTMGWSVPAHARLADGFNAAVHARLVRTNWLRTLAWTAHAMVAVAVTVLALSRD